ncbi:arginase-1 isoform X2 [Drosophila takahashii]|uniref:arginase-1 isoform X2 n=1 Tax=Drosophila takahashii TaxID=29030 RepID=UPI001CF8FECA|nr:arginase-1 isoform X1 [Drosophila takahashii]
MWWSRKLASRCLRLHRAKSTASSEPEQTLGIIGVPFAKGQGKQGVELAPDLLRQSSLRQVLQSSHDGLVIRDYGNLQYAVDEPLLQQQRVHYHHIRNYADFMACNRALIEQVKLMLAENSQFLAIGGDHAIGFGECPFHPILRPEIEWESLAGSVAGHLQHTPNLSLVWIDAHADINLHSTSQSGNIHGMPVSFLLEQLRTTWQHAGLQDIAPNCLPKDQLVYIGLRDIDPYEAFILNKVGIRYYAMDTIDRVGVPKIIEMTLDALDPQNKIHVSFDIDALDSNVAPSTGTAVRGGLTLREGISIVEALRDTKRVQGVDLVEINPKLGSERDVRTTVESGLEILKSMFGYRRSGKWSNIDTGILGSD